MNIFIDANDTDDDFVLTLSREVYLNSLRKRFEPHLKEMIDELLHNQSVNVDVIFPIGAQTYTQNILEWMKEYLMSKQSTEIHVVNQADKMAFCSMYTWNFLRDYSLGRIRFARNNPEKNGFWPTERMKYLARSTFSNAVLTITVCKTLEPSKVSVDLDAVESGLSV